MPDKLKELQALFMQEEESGVRPLDNSQFQRAIAPRPSGTAGQTVFTYFGEKADIPLDDSPEHPEQVAPAMITLRALFGE